MHNTESCKISWTERKWLVHNIRGGENKEREQEREEWGTKRKENIRMKCLCKGDIEV